MSILDDIKRFARPYEDEEDSFEDEFENTSPRSTVTPIRSADRSNKVVNIHKKVALSTYIITPYNVEILGDLIDELENKGLYF